jgi:hypothetical protein
MRILYERHQDIGPNEVREYSVEEIVNLGCKDGRDVVATAEILARLVDTLTSRGLLTADDIDTIAFGYSGSPGRVIGFVPEDR